MGLSKREHIRELVFAALDEGTLPNPRASAQDYARHLIDAGETDCPQPSAARYVRMSVQDYDEAPEEDAPSILSDIQHRSSHDEENDVYSFWPPGNRRPFQIAGSDLRQMKRQYSNPPMGEGLTINALCQAWGLPRDVFKFIARERGWTHDQDEFTSEEHAGQTTAELLRDREMRSRGELHRAAAKQQHAQVKADAAKWRAFHDSILDEVRSSLSAPVQLGELGVLSFGGNERMMVLSP